MFRMGTVGMAALVAFTVVGLSHVGLAAQEQGDVEVSEKDSSQAQAPVLKALEIRIVQDNYRCGDALETAWGFAAYVTGPDERLLFDTGSNGDLLLRNMAKLDIAPDRVDTVILSHVHADHTGGLVGFLKQHSDVDLYCLASFPARFKDVARGYGARLVEVDLPQQICENVFTTGSMGKRIHEQALVVRTDVGLVIVTGCAHPGVVKMIERVKTLHEQDIALVIGGFHLGWAKPRQIEEIMNALDRLGVRYVAPTHCSGDIARTLFEKRFGARYIKVGVGKTITLADLKQP